MSDAAQSLNTKLIAPAFTYVPLFAAQRRGFFARHGLDCSYEFVGSGDAVTAALKSGDIRFALNTPEGVLADRARGGSLVVLAGLTNRLPFRLIGLERHATIESLRGGTIGVSSLTEGTVHVITTMLASAGLTYPEDYRLEVVGTHPTRWELLQQGAIDAGLQLTPYDHIAINAGFSDLGDPTAFFPEFSFGVIAADAQWAAENSETAIGILQSLVEATEWVHQDREGAIAVLVEETGTSPELAALSLESMIDGGVLPRDLEFSRPGLEVVLGTMRDDGVLPEGASLDADSYIDESYLDEARQRSASDQK